MKSIDEMRGQPKDANNANRINKIIQTSVKLIDRHFKWSSMLTQCVPMKNSVSLNRKTL